MKDNERQDRFLVQEMLRHAEVLAAVAREGKATLDSSATNRYAVEHATELFAEAAGKVSQVFKKTNPSVPWDRLRPLRHDVAHPYDLGAAPVNVDQLWRFMTRDAPRIPRHLRNAKFPTDRKSTEY